MFDIGVYAYLRALFYQKNDEPGKKGIPGKAPKSSAAMPADPAGHLLLTTFFPS